MKRGGSDPCYRSPNTYSSHSASGQLRNRERGQKQSVDWSGSDTAHDPSHFGHVLYPWRINAIRSCRFICEKTLDRFAQNGFVADVSFRACDQNRALARMIDRFACGSNAFYCVLLCEELTPV